MSEPKKTESFAGNVMKYSIATYLGFGISGAALIIKGVLPAESYAVPASFMAYTMSLMNVGMLGWTKACCAFTTNRLPVPPGAACLPRVPGFRCWSCCWRAASAASFSPSRWRRLWPWGQRCRAGAVFVPERCSVHAGALPQRAAPAGKQCARLHHRNAVDAGLPEPDLPAARLCYPGRPRFCAGCGVQLCGGRSVLLAAGF